jgi:hypothetical protein
VSHDELPTSRNCQHIEKGDATCDGCGALYTTIHDPPLVSNVGKGAGLSDLKMLQYGRYTEAVGTAYWLRV